MRILRTLAAFAWCLVCFGCHMGLVPHSPRVARASGYEFRLGETQHVWIPDAAGTSQQLDVHVGALPQGTHLQWVGVAEASQKPCSHGFQAVRIRVLDGSRKPTGRDEPKPGDILSVGVSLSAWQMALSRPSRLDLLFVDPSGVMKCAAFPLVDERPEERWDLVGSTWTWAMPMTFEHFQNRVDNIESLVLFGVEVGRWIGPVRLHVMSGGGASECPRDVCPPMKGGKDQQTSKNEKYYVPIYAGVGGTLLQLGPLALEAKAEYRVAFTATETYGGLERSFLHGPVITPSIMITAPDPMAPGIRGGTRRGFGVGGQLPLAYVMSARGDSTFSIGASLVFLFPLK